MIKECIMCWLLVAGASPPLQSHEHLTLMVLQEASGEPFLGQVAVAGVAIDRMKSPAWPNDMPNVIYQPNQFEAMLTLRDHSLNEIALARKAVAWAWRGLRPCGQAAYWFHNLSIKKPKTWTFAKFRCQINNHKFYGEKHD